MAKCSVVLFCSVFFLLCSAKENVQNLRRTLLLIDLKDQYLYDEYIYLREQLNSRLSPDEKAAIAQMITDNQERWYVNDQALRNLKDRVIASAEYEAGSAILAFRLRIVPRIATGQ